RAGELRGGKGRPVRTHQNSRAGNGQARHHGKLRRARLHRYRDASGDAGSGARSGRREDPPAPARPSGGNRARGALPRRRELGVHYRRRRRRQRRVVHAMTTIPAEELSYGLDVAGLDPAALGEAVRAVVASVMADPLRFGAWMTKVALNEQMLGANMLRRLAGESPASAAEPSPGDRRFADPAWKENPLLAGMVEAYLARARATAELVDSAVVPESTRRKARFAVGMLMDPLAPSNVPWINPAVV